MHHEYPLVQRLEEKEPGIQSDRPKPFTAEQVIQKKYNGCGL